jgi:biopolymer transport protein TolR
MARTFRRQRSSHAIAEINVTNLIDLGFTLLIIFMISTPLINQEQTIPVRLPVESKSIQQKPDPLDQFESVSIDSKGNFYINTQKTPLGLVQLRSVLQTWGVMKKPPVIRIRGDGKVPYEKVVQLMDELKKANLMRTTFDTQSDS